MSTATERESTGASGPPLDVFGEFCAAGLWPGLGTGLAARLAGAGITAPALVTAARLELVEGVGSKRALRLAAAFDDARPCYEVAELLVACRVPARYAGPAVARLGASAARQLREDPWRLLSLPQLRPDQADWFARQMLGATADPQDPRRGRALVGYLLARAARDGHTAVPAETVARSLGRFRISDPAAAIGASVDEGAVLPFSESGPHIGEGSGGAGPDSADLAASPDAIPARTRPPRSACCWPSPDMPWPRRQSPKACNGWRPWPNRSRPISPGHPLSRRLRIRLSSITLSWIGLSSTRSGRWRSTACACSAADRGPARAARWRLWCRWPPGAACG